MEKHKTTPNRTTKLVGLAAVALLAGIIANWLLNPPSSQNQPLKLENATALPSQARPLPPFTLLDQDGQPFGNERLQGHWSFMFFGYTHCPDICPTTLATLNQTMERITQLGDAEKTQVVFVSVDPERDVQDTLKSYVKFFNPEFIGLTGTQEAISGLTKNLGILHIKTANPNDPDSYLMDHSASVLLIGPDGDLRALFGAPHQAEKIAEDYHKLREYHEHG
jgi:protein SCO1/2